MIKIENHPDHPGVYRFAIETELSAPRDEVFAFFSDAANLEIITPAWLSFQIVTRQPIVMTKGTLIDYRLKLRGIPMRWRTEITRWDQPVQFVDRQIRGPYRLWEHTHQFEETPFGTLMTDIVHYSVPGGALIDRLFVRGDIVKIFNYRGEQIRAHFG